MGYIVNYDDLEFAQIDSLSDIFIDASARRFDFLKLLPIIKQKNIEEHDIELIGDGTIIMLENAIICRNTLNDVVFKSNIFYLHTSDILGFCLTH